MQAQRLYMTRTCSAPKKKKAQVQPKYVLDELPHLSKYKNSAQKNYKNENAENASDQPPQSQGADIHNQSMINDGVKGHRPQQKGVSPAHP